MLWFQKRQSDLADTHDLLHYLYLPIQRMIAYTSLLKDILQHTSRAHEDYHNLTLALEGVRDASAHAMERAEQRKNIDKVIQVQENLLDEMELAVPHRRFIFEGEAQFISRGGECRERILYLFNDLLMVCKPRRNSKKLKVDFVEPLNTLRIEDVPDSRGAALGVGRCSLSRCVALYALAGCVTLPLLRLLFSQFGITLKQASSPSLPPPPLSTSTRSYLVVALFFCFFAVAVLLLSCCEMPEGRYFFQFVSTSNSHLFQTTDKPHWLAIFKSTLATFKAEQRQEKRALDSVAVGSRENLRHRILAWSQCKDAKEVHTQVKALADILRAEEQRHQDQAAKQL
jgi:RhoGEF domain